MGEIRTKEEAIGINDTRIRNVTKTKGITKNIIADNFEDILVNLYEGAAASRSVLMTGSFTYTPKLHRGAKIIVKNLSAPAIFTIPLGWTDLDWFFIFNQGGHDVNFSYNQGQILNIVDDQQINIVQSGGYAIIFKDMEPAGPANNLWAAGRKLTKSVAFTANAGYPNVTNPTTTGGLFNGSFSKNYQYWVQAVTNGFAPPPGNTQIKNQTGGLANFTNAGIANIVRSTAFTIPGATPDTEYDLYWYAEPTDGSTAPLSGKVDFRTAQDPVFGEIILRSNAFLKQGAGITNWDFLCNVDGVASSIMLVSLSLRTGLDFSVNNLIIGGKTFAKVAEAVTAGTSFPNYDYLFMATKAGMPANGTGIPGSIAVNKPSNTAALNSISVNIIILEGAQQIIIPSNRIKIFGGVGVADHAHTFTGLPGKYMLISFGSTHDPGDTVFLSFPASQIEILQGQDTEQVSRAVSYKIGTSGSNSVSVENGNTSKLNHIAVQVNTA